MRRVLLAAGLLLIMVVTTGMALEISYWKISDISYKVEDSVKGTGTFARYNYIAPNGPHFDHRIPLVDAETSVKKTEHGSGTLENEQISNSYRTNHLIQMDRALNITSLQSFASLNETNKMVFSPKTMTIGVGYYSLNPITFKSLLSEKTVIKNFATETALSHATFRAKAIDKDLKSTVSDSYLDQYGWTYFERGGAGLDIRENVTDGSTHIGAIQGNTENNRNSAVASPVIEVDQDFVGSYSIATKLSIEWPSVLIRAEDEWLPCCSNGWKDLNPLDAKPFKSAKGVFDCTCQKAGPSAESPRN